MGKIGKKLSFTQSSFRKIKILSHHKTKISLVVLILWVYIFQTDLCNILLV